MLRPKVDLKEFCEKNMIPQPVYESYCLTNGWKVSCFWKSVQFWSSRHYFKKKEAENDVAAQILENTAYSLKPSCSHLNENRCNFYPYFVSDYLIAEYMKDILKKSSLDLQHHIIYQLLQTFNGQIQVEEEKNILKYQMNNLELTEKHRFPFITITTTGYIGHCMFITINEIKQMIYHSKLYKEAVQWLKQKVDNEIPLTKEEKLFVNIGVLNYDGY